MKRVTPVFLVFVFVAVSVSAQTSISLDPKTIVAASFAALGTSASVLQGTTAQGTITLNGETGSIVIKTLGQAVRYEVTLQSQQFTTVWVNGMGVRSQDGKSYKLPGGMSLYYRATHMPLVSRMADVSLSDTQIQYVGAETVNNNPAWHVKMWSVPTDTSTPANVIQSLSEFHVYVDQSSGLPVEFITYDFDPQAVENRSEVDTYLTDYRKVNGAMVPFHITRYAQGAVQSDIVISSVTTGVTQSPSDFQ